MADVMPPIRFSWNGEALVPLGGFATRQANEHFVVGEQYKMVEHADRSINSHNHYFATIADAVETMPDELRETYPTAEHLRKKALIRKGWRDEREFVCDSKAAAARLAAFIKPLDTYAIIEHRETVVRVWTAKSQSKKAMPGKGEFQRSKQDVLDFIDDLLGVERGETAKAA